jgi:YD repeat-containing protein
MAGSFVDYASKVHGFVCEGGYFIAALDHPEGSDVTATTDINNGVIVGSYTSNALGDLTHAFVYDNGNYYNIDWPGSLMSSANGINDSGVIVGNYTIEVGGVRRNLGFIATPTNIAANSLLLNPGFEADSAGPWTFYTNTKGSFDIDRPGNGSEHAAHVTVGQAGSNVQLYQAGITIKPNTSYWLRFNAYSKTGNDLSVWLFKHEPPFTNYGLSNYLCDLTTIWSRCSVEFTTSGFNETVNDARLMFWLAPFAAAGEEYFIDDVILEEAPSDSIIKNPRFEAITPSPWEFYTDTVGSFNADRLGNGSPHAGHVAVAQAGSNIQLYQPGLRLEPNTSYKLIFSAYSNTGNDLSVWLFKHDFPFTNYGLSNFVCDLTTNWRNFSVEFTTSGFDETVNDARLMFWLAPFANPGDEYFFDNVMLVKKVGAPNVVGMVQDDARFAITSAQLVVGPISQSNSTTVPPGHVISQYPLSGTSLAEGAYVNLVISIGPVMVVVPDVTGMTQAGAETAIMTAGLSVGTITTANSSTVSSGQVISQNPAAGVSTPQGSAVALVISLGPLMVSAPDVTGMTQASAESVITAAGLTVGTVATANSNTVAAGSVISQNPTAATSVAEGTSINLVISSGPAIGTVPNVVGMTRSDAQSALVNASLSVGALTFVNSDAVAAGDVISQNPAPGASVVPRTAVTLQISLGPVSSLPPDPAIVAPELDKTVATTMQSAIEFIYSGANPIQTGVATGIIEAKRVALMRGKVMNINGDPLPGVTIRIPSHSEFGQTLSRADGMFDMAVNGGSYLTVDYQKEGYIPSQRQVNVPWQDYIWLPDVIMIVQDALATTVDFASSDPVQVARGSVQTDSAGSRQATLLILQGTQATMIMPDDSTQPLTDMTVRITEFTVGPNGPKAMPAALPPTSAYTYAAEINADEAVAAAAKSIAFNKPLIHYVENFYGFPIGTSVPVGYYDRDRSAWVPSDSGLVIKILDTSSGFAALDLTGSGTAANPAALASLKITDSERQCLASLYASGTELWRVTISHFTPLDWNWGWGPGPGAKNPDNPQANPDNNEDSSQNAQCPGCIIEVQNQVLGESVPIAGTSFNLHYRSDHTPGDKSKSKLVIPLSGSSIPASLDRIDLEVTVAGRLFKQSFTPANNLSSTFRWDGLDAFGRKIQGTSIANIKIGYHYPAVFHSTPTFAQMSGQFIASGVAPREGWTSIQQYTVLLNSFLDGRSNGLGVWTLSPHHFFDSVSNVLHKGNGIFINNSNKRLNQIMTIAGKDEMDSWSDGIPSLQASLFYPTRVALGADGSVYIADYFDNRIRKIDSSGIISTIAGNRNKGFSGDGGPATQAALNLPFGIAVGPDGSIYIVDTGNQRIRKVDPGGIISTIAGNGDRGFSGDGGPATQAAFKDPTGVALGPDGSIYIIDYNNRIRKVDPNGTIFTIAGNNYGIQYDGMPAIQANLFHPIDISLGPDGSIYIVEQNERIRKVTPSGLIYTIAGNGNEGFSGDGGPATQAALKYPNGIAVGPDGSIYIVDTGNQRIRKVDSSGIISTIAGNGNEGFSGDGGPANQAALKYPDGISIGHNGSIYIVDELNHRIRKIGIGIIHMPGISSEEISYASEDGSDIYIFSGDGRHLRTLNALTGSTLYSFSYDSEKRLSSVTDAYSNVVTIERSVSGDPVAIIAPFGQRTSLTLDANGYLSSITNPANEVNQFVYTSTGLLTQKTDPRGNVHTMSYDANGLLIHDADPAGGFSALSRVDIQPSSASKGGREITFSTALSNPTKYRIDYLNTGDWKKTDVFGDSTITTTQFGTNGVQTSLLRDGTTVNMTEGPEPRFGMLSPIPSSRVIKTPSGLTSTTTTTRSVTFSLLNPTLLATQTDIVKANGRIYTYVFDAASNSFANTSPAGRQSTKVVNALGQVLSSNVAGLNTASYAYDSQGRPISIIAGSGPDARVTSFSYNNAGYLESITDPVGRNYNFLYDDTGRVVQQTIPGERITGYGYDANGNVASVTPPGRPSHGFSFTSVNQVSAYTPPFADTGINQTLYTYNTERKPTSITRPDGKTLTYAYNPAGKLSATTIERGQFSFAYHCCPN